MNDKETILKSVDIGITNYIVKPVNTTELISVLEESVKTLLEINSSDFESIVEKDKINNLKNELTKIIKIETGKGPQDIRVSMSYNRSNITLVDCYTTYEKSLLANDQNYPLVDHNRNIFLEIGVCP